MRTMLWPSALRTWSERKRIEAPRHMPESQGHIDLVRSLSAWIEGKFRNGSYSFHVIADLPDSPEKPDYIGGFRPDVYARAAGKHTILGEAKTVNDLECLHTERQIGAFLKYLSLSP